MTKGARRLAQVPGTQQEKAERLEVTQQTVSSWETGRSEPRGKQLLKIKHEYGIELEDWIEPAEEPSPDTERAAS